MSAPSQMTEEQQEHVGVSSCAGKKKLGSQGQS